MDKFDVLVSAVLLSFIVIICGACLYSESMERECVSDAMGNGYVASDIRAICDIK